MLDLWIFKQEAVLPFPEVFGQLVVGFLTHHVFFNLVVAFDFLDDGVGVEVGDRDDHASLHAIKIQCAEVLVHGGDYFPFFVLEGESDVGRFRSIPFLNVLLEGEDGGLRV